MIRGRAAAAVCASILTAWTASCAPTAHTAPATTRPAVGTSATPSETCASTSPQEGAIGDDEQQASIASTPGHAGAPTDSDITTAVAAATQVVAGWLTGDQTSRLDRLRGVAAEALIDAFNDPRYTPIAHATTGPVHVVVAEAMRIVTRHRLDTGAAVEFTLIPEPTALHGWIAIAITEV